MKQFLELSHKRERERERERESKIISNSRKNNSFGGYFSLKKLFTFNKYLGENIWAFLGSVDTS